MRNNGIIPASSLQPAFICLMAFSSITFLIGFHHIILQLGLPHAVLQLFFESLSQFLHKLGSLIIIQLASLSATKHRKALVAQFWRQCWSWDNVEVDMGNHLCGSSTFDYMLAVAHYLLSRMKVVYLDNTCIPLFCTMFQSQTPVALASTRLSTGSQ